MSLTAAPHLGEFFESLVNVGFHVDIHPSGGFERILKPMNIEDWFVNL